MTKIDIFSGFLGAGKTTLIKKLLQEAFSGEQAVLIENEFGEIGIDGGFLKETGIEIREMNSGCICCSLSGDFGMALQEVISTYHPDRILIEPSGVGKLSDVIKAVEQTASRTEVKLNSIVTVVDASKCKMYMRNFGEFFNDQIQCAGTIVLSRTDKAGEEQTAQAVELIRQVNGESPVVTTPVSLLDGRKLLEIIEGVKPLVSYAPEKEICPVCGRARHVHASGGKCGCHNHEHNGERCGHGHKHDGEHCSHGDEHDGEHCSHGDKHDGEHCSHGDEHDGEYCSHGDKHDGEYCSHGHEHDGECCSHGDKHDGERCSQEHDHHAEEIFSSWGRETVKSYTRENVEEILRTLNESQDYGMVLRAKGIVAGRDGQWICFDMVPGETDIRVGAADYTGRLCVIGSGLREEKLDELFGLR